MVMSYFGSVAERSRRASYGFISLAGTRTPSGYTPWSRFTVGCRPFHRIRRAHCRTTFRPFSKGYCQILWTTIFQAAGFSCFTPSMKITPLITSGSSLDPFKARHPFEADSINLCTIARHAARLPLPFVLS